jgi:hypothetical protein
MKHVRKTTPILSMLAPTLMMRAKVYINIYLKKMVVAIQNLIRGITISNHFEKVNFEYLDSDEQMNRDR